MNIKEVLTIVIPFCVFTQSSLQSGDQGKSRQDIKTIAFQRRNEPQEQAFSMLIPQGWQMEGGLFRVNPLDAGGVGNALVPKLDLTIKKDAAGSVMIRTLPSYFFCDISHSPAGQMGLFPPGSNYNGMTVMPVMPAVTFLEKHAIQYAHPRATEVQILERRPLPRIARAHHQRETKTLPMKQHFAYGAGLIRFSYRENGMMFEEAMFTIIENWGQLGGGMWTNVETGLIRSPGGEIKKWNPVLRIMRESVRLNRPWVAKEVRAQIQAGHIIARTQAEIERIERQIIEHRQKTNAEINNDMFLTLTEQEEYVNPYTNEVEMGSNQWEQRWVNESGDVIYSNDANYDPNVDVNLNRSDWKTTPVRPRFPQ